METIQHILNNYDIGNIVFGWIRDYYWLSRLIFAFSYLVGMIFMFRALYYLKVYGEARTMMATQANAATPIALIICGACLIFLPTAIDMLNFTVYQTNTILSYDSGDGGYNYFMTVVSLVIQLVGLIAVVRGFMILSTTGQQGRQPGMTGKGITHLIGGILAVNFWATTAMLSSLFGVFWL